MKDVHIMIPARLASSRLPEKLLCDVAGKPLIQRVYENACAMQPQSIHIATDSKQIQSVCEGFGANVHVTCLDHQNGTERLSEACETLGFDSRAIVLNRQADELLLSKAWCLAVVQRLRDHPEAVMSTLATKIIHPDDHTNPNVVKVVFSNTQRALLFSRANIPVRRDLKHLDPVRYRHIGVYAYRVEFLKRFKQLSLSPLESMERLEQLRVLWHDYTIQVGVVEPAEVLDVNTYSDLERARQYFERENQAID